MDDLPIDIIENIKNCLNTNKIDVSVSRPVCKSWRSSIPAFQNKPPIRICIDLSSFERIDLNLIETVIYGLVQPPSRTNSNIGSSSLVVKVRASDQENRLFRAHPLIPLSRSPCPSNLLDFKVFELGKSLGDSTCSRVRAAISSNPDCPAVMVLVPYSTLYHCKLIGGVAKTENCTLVKKDNTSDEFHCWIDVVFFNSRFYAVDQHETVTIDSSLEMKVIASTPVGRKSEFFCCNMYLVESQGELLLVYKYMGLEVYKAARSFDVYKLNVPEKQWVLMRSLNDRILFVGDRFDDGSFAAPAQDFPCLRRNHIYFSQGRSSRDVNIGSLPYSDEFQDGDAANSCPASHQNSLMRSLIGYVPSVRNTKFY